MTPVVIGRRCNRAWSWAGALVVIDWSGAEALVVIGD